MGFSQYSCEVASWRAECRGGCQTGGMESAVVELVEVTHRLHDRFEVRARIERVEQLRGIGQERIGSLDRGPHIVLRRIREAAMSRQQEFRVEPLDAFQRLD